MFLELNQEIWTPVEDEHITEDFYNFPQLPKECFSQLWELTTIHGARKGIAVASHLRKKEVVADEDPQTFDEYQELICQYLQEPQVEVLRLEKPTESYEELVQDGILPPWPGPGYIFRIVCAPAHRSDTDKSAYKTPMVYVLDEDITNPLNCSDVFKRIGATFCFNCPSTNGGISSCCHVAFIIMILGAYYALEISYNKAVKIVSIKNPYSFLHPSETMTSAQSVPIPKNVKRTSLEKRANDPLLFPDNFLYWDEDEIDEYYQEGSVEEDAVERQDSVDQEFNGEEGSIEVNETSILQEECITGISFQEQSRELNVDVQSIASSRGTTASLYGGSVANVERYIDKVVRRNPDQAIPPINNDRKGNNIFLLTTYQRIFLYSKELKISAIFKSLSFKTFYCYWHLNRFVIL